MKKFAISLIALAALSTAVLAEGKRDDDLAQAGILKSGYGTQLNGTSTGSYALSVGRTSGNAFVLATQNAEANVRSTDNH